MIEVTINLLQSSYRDDGWTDIIRFDISRQPQNLHLTHLLYRVRSKFMCNKRKTVAPRTDPKIRYDYDCILSVLVVTIFAL